MIREEVQRNKLIVRNGKQKKRSGRSLRGKDERIIENWMEGKEDEMEARRSSEKRGQRRKEGVDRLCDDKNR